MMDMIVAIIQPSKLEDVKQALVAAGIQGMTVTGSKGFGRQKGHPMAFLGLYDLENRPFKVDFLPKVRIEIVVPSDRTDLIVNTIVQTAQTGKIGDGKVFVIPVTKAVRIRTGEQNEIALSMEEEAAAK
jgi:nitrogen regulatory protein P-II 1